MPLRWRVAIIATLALVVLLQAAQSTATVLAFMQQGRQNARIAAVSARADHIQCEAGNDVIAKIRSVLNGIAVRLPHPVETQKFFQPILDSPDLQSQDCDKFTEKK